MDTSKLLTLAAVGVGGYFLYENLFATPAAATTPTPAAGGTPVPSGTPTGTTTTAPPASTVNASALCAGTMAAVSGSEDPNFTPSGNDFLGSPYHWQFYWNLQPGAPALDINSMFSDTSSPISGATFCATVQSYLAAHGLSGYFYGMGQDTGVPELDETFNVTAGPGNTGILTPTGGTPNAPTVASSNVPVLIAIGVAAVILAVVVSDAGVPQRMRIYAK